MYNSYISYVNCAFAKTVSQAYIHGSPEMYIRSGSDISLSCVAKDMPEPPSHFTWYKGMQIFSTGGNDGHQPLQQNSHLQHQQHQANGKQSSFLGKSSIMTSLSGRKVTIETSQQGLENLLLIRNAVASDSGNYTCIPAGAEPASIVVHVLNGTSAKLQFYPNYIKSFYVYGVYVYYDTCSSCLAALLNWHRCDPDGDIRELQIEEADRTIKLEYSMRVG